jgi:hypothetical protein
MASNLKMTISSEVLAFYLPAIALANGGGIQVSPSSPSVTRDNGTESTQCDLVYFLGAGSVATSATNSYDMAGSLTQPDGTAFLPARLDVIVLKNTGTVTLYVGPHATAGVGFGATGFVKAVGDLVAVHAGQTRVLRASSAGAAVTATTADIIAVENSSSTVVGTYQLGIYGRSV